jgi:hypothetical protein
MTLADLLSQIAKICESKCGVLLVFGMVKSGSVVKNMLVVLIVNGFAQNYVRSCAGWAFF